MRAAKGLASRLGDRRPLRVGLLSGLFCFICAAWGAQGAAPSFEFDSLKITNVRFPTATLSVTANPNGAPTDVWFSYYTNFNFMRSTVPAPIGAGVTGVLVTNQLAGLLVAVPYSVYATASNEFGSVTHPLRGFTISNTRPSLSAPASVEMRSTGTTVAHVTVSDLETAAQDLMLTVQITNSPGTNPNLLVAPDGVALAGSGPVRDLVLRPNPLEVGVTFLTLSVEDAQRSRSNITIRVSVPVFESSGLALDAISMLADVDGDGRLDVIDGTGWRRVPGGGVVPAGEFHRASVALPALPALADANNDGYVDFAAAGPRVVVFEPGVPGRFRPLPTLARPGRFMQWVDYDLDGDMDLFAFGSASPAANAPPDLWRNDGGLNFTRIDSGLPRFAEGQLVRTDVDLDGDPDVLVFKTGDLLNSSNTLLLNDGAGNFTNANARFPDLALRSAAWGDMDNDGRPELAVAGSTTSRSGVTTNAIVILRMDERFVFSEVARLGLLAPADSVELADVDGDGLLDIKFFYLSNLSIYSWKAGQFFFIGPTHIESTGALGDFDGDLRLDLANVKGALARNQSPRTNLPPAAPVLLAEEVATGEVMLRWGRASDPNQSGGLTYNVRVGTTPGGVEVLSPLADVPSGRRRIASPGNAGYSRRRKLRALKPGTYYWSVQAVDHGFAGGPFAAERSFTIGGAPPRLVSLALGPAGKVSLKLSLVRPGRFALQSSVDLKDWADLSASDYPGGETTVELAEPAERQRFFRLLAK